MPRRRRRPDVLLTELDDRSGVVLHLVRQRYYPLSRSGVLLWRRYDDNVTVDDDDLVGVLVDRYGIDVEHARRDVAVFVERLAAEAILETVEP